MRIAILSYHYSVEFSPTIKALATYLAGQGHRVEIFTDRLCRSKTFRLRGVAVHTNSTTRPHFARRLLSRMLRDFHLRPPNPRVGDGEFRASALPQVRRADWVICVDSHSLESLWRDGFNLRRVVYICLEGLQDFCYLSDRPRVVKRLLTSCAFCIAASGARAADIMKELNATIDFEYLPVSLRPDTTPLDPRPRLSADGPIRLVYSGYFADWALLPDLVRAFQGILRTIPFATLLLQGHHVYTDDHVDMIRGLVRQVPGVTIDTAFYNDGEHRELLCQHDVGIALYAHQGHEAAQTNPWVYDNWQNLLFSSGKIASYLWAGLPVLTNIRDAACDRPPFLKVSDISARALIDAVGRLFEQQAVYRSAARRCADEHYNFDRHMDRIMERLCAANDRRALRR